MKQVTKHYCRCGDEAIARRKSTGEWLCIVCMVKDICNRKGIDNVYMGRREDDSLDFLVPLVDLLPLDLHWN